MSHVSKVVSLVIVVLVSLAGVALAADPTKVPPKLSPSQTPPATYKLPDLVPKKRPWPPGGPLETGLKVWCDGNKMYIQSWAMNTGASTAGTFKKLVRVNGAVWNVALNPYTVPAGLVPGMDYASLSNGYAAPHPITGTVLVSVEIDSEHTVAESNENNNVASITAPPCK